MAAQPNEAYHLVVNGVYDGEADMTMARIIKERLMLPQWQIADWKDAVSHTNSAGSSYVSFLAMWANANAGVLASEPGVAYNALSPFWRMMADKGVAVMSAVNSRAGQQGLDVSPIDPNNDAATPKKLTKRDGYLLLMPQFMADHFVKQHAMLPKSALDRFTVTSVIETTGFAEQKRVPGRRTTGGKSAATAARLAKGRNISVEFPAVPGLWKKVQEMHTRSAFLREVVDKNLGAYKYVLLLYEPKSDKDDADIKELEKTPVADVMKEIGKNPDFEGYTPDMQAELAQMWIENIALWIVKNIVNELRARYNANPTAIPLEMTVISNAVKNRTQLMPLHSQFGQPINALFVEPVRVVGIAAATRQSSLPAVKPAVPTKKDLQQLALTSREASARGPQQRGILVNKNPPSETSVLSLGHLQVTSGEIDCADFTRADLEATATGLRIKEPHKMTREALCASIKAAVKRSNK